MKPVRDLFRGVAAYAIYLWFIFVVFPIESLRDQAKEND